MSSGTIAAGAQPPEQDGPASAGQLSLPDCAERLDSGGGKLYDVAAVLRALADLGEAKFDAAEGVNGDTVQRLAEMGHGVLLEIIEGLFEVRDQLVAASREASA